MGIAPSATADAPYMRRLQYLLPYYWLSIENGTILCFVALSNQNTKIVEEPECRPFHGSDSLWQECSRQEFLLNLVNNNSAKHKLAVLTVNVVSMSDRIASTKILAYSLLRIALGVNFAGHGFVRIGNGVDLFAATTAAHLAKSALPHGFVIGFAYAIPFIEAALGLGLIFGLFTRATLVCGTVFMMGLTIGVTSNQQWDVAGQQLLYSFIFFVLLYLSEQNGYSLDALLKRRPSLSASAPQ